MKKALCFLVLCTPFFVRAQEMNGIKWENGLSWQRVKQKAKEENKYIFIDAFATWCGPCKKMDKEIYSNDTVGDYFNDRFVSVKVQMDQTDKDNDAVKSWYNDAQAISKEYKIQAYPSLIFLSPAGTIVHQEMGYKSVPEFIAVAKTATTPGKVYDNPYKEYDSLVLEYKQGKKDYLKMPYLFKTATQLIDTSLAKMLVSDYIAYLKGLSDNELYTKENIEFLANFIHSKSRFFHLFYPNSNKIDSVMNQKGYGAYFVGQVMLREDIEPFLKTRAEGIKKMKLNPDQKFDSSWQPLYKSLNTKYNRYYSERGLLEAKIVWYERQNDPVYFKYFVQAWEKYYRKEADGRVMDGMLNNVAYDLFKRSTNKHEINMALQWMNGVAQRAMKKVNENSPEWFAAGFFDTYANLYYKSSQIKDALYWEKQAAMLAPKDQEIQDNYAKMLAGRQTW